MKDFIVMFILLFIVNFLPMVYGWGQHPVNPWWIIAGYTVVAGLYAIGSGVSKQQKKDRELLSGENRDG